MANYGETTTAIANSTYVITTATQPHQCDTLRRHSPEHGHNGVSIIHRQRATEPVWRDDGAQYCKNDQRPTQRMGATALDISQRQISFGYGSLGVPETSTVSTLLPTISVASLGSCSLDSCSMHRLADYLLIAMYCHADYCDAYLSVRVGQVPDVPCGFAH